MKKVINGRVYDTATAKKLAVHEVGSPEYASWYKETLYQKRTNELFLHGVGNSASPYGVPHPNSLFGAPAENIKPLTWSDANDWGEANLELKTYEEIFGDYLEQEEDYRIPLTLSISSNAVKVARRMAAKSNMTLSAYIESLILKS